MTNRAIESENTPGRGQPRWGAAIWENAGFRGGGDPAGGLCSVYEDSGMRPMLAALAEELDGITAERRLEGGPPARWLQSAREALAEEAKNLRSAEGRWRRTLPKMAEAAAAGSVRGMFEELEEQTKGQERRLVEVTQLLNLPGGEQRSLRMEAVANGIREVIEENVPGGERDGSLIAGAQKALEYQAGCYECARTFAYILGLGEAAELFEATAHEAAEAQAKLRNLGEFLQPQISGGMDYAVGE